MFFRTLLAAPLAWAITAWCLWEANPSAWTTDQRMFCIVVAILTGVGIYSVSAIMGQKKEAADRIAEIEDNIQGIQRSFRR